MNERKELLNEESYLKSKNKLLKIAKIILIAGLVKRIKLCQKERAENKTKIKEIENQNTNLIEQN